MSALSLSGAKLDYGINVKECFWIRNGIITEKNIRISRDEEIIARLYGYMLLGETTSPSSSTLDRFYDASGTYHESLNDKINSLGLLSVMDTFSKVIADFENIFKSLNSNFNSILFKDKDIGGKAKVFQAMFLSLYELKSKNLFINNYESIAKALMGIGAKEFREITNDEEWNVSVRNKAIRRFKSIMEPLMIKRIKNPFADNEWKLKLETQLLCASGSEKQMYDFKLGISNLKDGEKNKECISNFIKTLTAMANTNPQKEGIIIIGIANNKSAAEDHKKHYNSNWIEFNNYFITGIDSEIKKYWNNDIDNYCNYIKQVVSHEPIQEDVKSQILRNFEPIDYQGKTLFIITCKNTDHSFTYNKEFYERHGSHTEKVEIGSSAFNALIERTTKK